MKLLVLQNLSVLWHHALFYCSRSSSSNRSLDSWIPYSDDLVSKLLHLLVQLLANDFIVLQMKLCADWIIFASLVACSISWKTHQKQCSVTSAYEWNWRYQALYWVYLKHVPSKTCSVSFENFSQCFVSDVSMNFFLLL